MNREDWKDVGIVLALLYLCGHVLESAGGAVRRVGAETWCYVLAAILAMSFAASPIAYAWAWENGPAFLHTPIDVRRDGQEGTTALGVSSGLLGALLAIGSLWSIFVGTGIHSEKNRIKWIAERNNNPKPL